MQSLKHWKLVRDNDGIAWAIIDQQESSTNTLGSSVIFEFAQLLTSIENDLPRGLVILSGKANGFIAGADIEEYSQLTNAEEIRKAVQRNWDLLNRLEALRCPTLALIKGHCLGGGLELALACRYRIAVDDSATRLSLPEVMLGIVPAWGGMLRLPRLVGPQFALELMLTGKGIDARAAARRGLVDECVPERVMHLAARNWILSSRPARRANGMAQLLNGPAKNLLATLSLRQLKKRVRQKNYPAPFAILETWQKYDGNWLKAPASSKASIEYIFAHPTARNLIRVFFLQQRLKNFGKTEDVAGIPPIRHVHVIGAGTMGGDIAAWCATRGLSVSLQDQTIERIAPAIARAHVQFSKKYRNNSREIRFALDRLIPDPEGVGVAKADVIIEAIFENIDAKQRLFADIETRAKPDALLATNTSSLRLEDIGSVLRAPQRLIGLHFFNPVAKMPLVEVISAEHTDPSLISRAMAFVHQLDKLPLPVMSRPGFLVNAVLGPYLFEAIRCVEEGIHIETVDAAACAFGMPIGPIELIDMIGLDIALAAGAALTGEANAPASLRNLIESGRLGKKSGRGFYRWKKDQAIKGKVGVVPSELSERLIAPIIQATQTCLQAGVVADADLADAGVIFGTGFAPHTGGPLNYNRARHPNEGISHDTITR